MHIGLRGNPPGATLRRDEETPDGLWRSLARNIAPGAATRVGDDEYVVPLDRFLASRNWLAATLSSYDCAASFTPDIRAILGRADSERDEVAEVLSGYAPPADVGELTRLLDRGRFTRELRPFQLRDLAHILALSHGANFSVPGAGKTSVSYALYEAERMRGRVERLLVVAPLSAFDAWFEEALECFSEAPVVNRFDQRIPRDTEVLLVNYQRLAARYPKLATWVAERSTHVILDEAHRMKRGRNGEWGSACLNIAHLAVRRDILTGTPAPQHPSDFSALLDFLWPNQASRIMPAASLIRDPPPDAMTQLTNRLRPLFARTSKNELGLDPPILRVELVEMKPIQREIYEAIRTRMRRAVPISMRQRTQLGDLGSVVMYLLEAATNPALLAKPLGGTPSTVTWPPDPIPPGSTLFDKVHGYARFETPVKFEKLAAIVAANTAQGRKTLVWSNFVANLLELADRVLEPFSPALIYGGVPSSDEPEAFLTRETELWRFREDPRCTVLLANPAAMSEGVSLHHVCHDAVYLDRTFNAGQYLQSLDRIHRLGLPPSTETRVTFLACTRTIDDTVDGRVRIKAARLGELLSDPNLATMALPDEEAYGSWIDSDDLDALFAHLEEENG